MREDLWEFDPTHTVIVAANHKPEVRGTDKGIWRRIQIVPWEVSIPDAERDPKLPEKLEAELEGIVAWCVQGALDWQRYGLAPPPEVEAETSEYQQEQDVLAGFIADKCVEGPDKSVKSDPLYGAYKEWCDLNGEYQQSQKQFTIKLKERGYEKVRTKVARIWRGIALKGDADPSPGDAPDTDPLPPESGIDKPNARDSSETGDGVDTDFRLSARIPTRISGLTGKGHHHPSPCHPDVVESDTDVASAFDDLGVS